MVMHDVPWTEEPKVEALEEVQQDSEEINRLMSKVKSIQTKVLKQQKMNFEEKQLTNIFAFKNGMLFVRKGDHNDALHSLQYLPGANNENEDFFVENPGGVFYVPDEANEIKEDILLFYTNIYQCGSTGKFSFEEQMTTVERTIRSKYYWHTIADDVQTGIRLHEDNKRVNDFNSTQVKDEMISSAGKKEASKWLKKCFPGYFQEESAVELMAKDSNSKWLVYGGAFNEPDSANAKSV